MFKNEYYNLFFGKNATKQKNSRTFVWISEVG